MTRELLGIPLRWWLGASLTVFVGTLLLVPVIVVRMRADYFLDREPPEGSFPKRHPAWSLAARLLKNAAGLILVAVGFALLVLPGQGLLTILLGVVLLDFPGKRALELRILRRKHVHATLDWIRKAFGRPALELPEP